MRHQLFLGAAVAAIMIPAAASAQETTSIIRGTVIAEDGTAVSGATVTIVNTPTGATSTATTDDSGRFTAVGLAPGGPYTVDVDSSAGSTQVTDIFTVQGQAFELPVTITGGGTEIVVTAQSIRGAGVLSRGPSTTLTQRDISKVASVNRDVRDLERRDPFATLDLSNSRAVSFAGVNPRFNRFTINGVQVGDSFGLNSDVNPTGRGPIPFDAIAQFSVSVAPYDFRQGNFSGGSINTVMLSGTNEFHGTGFYSQSTDNIQGKQIGSVPFVVPDYKSETYGATLSGPIIKDKLFFMVSGERNTDPRPLTPSTVSQVPGLTDATVSSIQATAKSVYNYDTGGVLSINRQKDEKVVGKLDWNIMDGQRFSVSYVNAFESSDILQNSSTSATSPALGLASDAYTRTVLLRAGIAQLNSDWTDKISTEARLVYKYTKVGQDPYLGRGFAQFRICTDPTSATTPSGGANAAPTAFTACSTGAPVIAFGPDISRQTNTLFFDTWGGSLLARYTAGGHEVKLLAEYNENRTYNAFLQNSAGAYYFDSLADFQNRSASTLNYANAVSLRTLDVAANFKYGQYTLGFQDDWAVSDTFNVTYGVRYDLYGMRTPIALNSFFLGRYGFANTKNYKGLDNFQPRASFDWKPVRGLSVRGGVGVFGGGSPDIYLSNSFSNTGVLSNSITTVTRATPGAGTVAGSQTTATCSAPYTVSAPNIAVCNALNGVTGTSIPAAVDTFLSTNLASLSTAPTASLAQDLHLPSVLKATFSADYRLFGINLGADFLYTDTLHAVTFTDLRSRIIGRLPDGRPRYAPITTATDTNTDIQFNDTTKGRSYIGVARFNKDFDFGLNVMGSYTWQDVKDVSPATSSTATSLYGNAAMNDPNNPAYGTSNDQTKWAFKYGLGYDHAFFGDYRTVFQLFGETRAGRPFSYTMQNNAGTRSPVFGTVSNNDRYLLYVPTGTSDPIVSYDSTATQDALEALIKSTNLADYRGKIAPKNIARSRAFTRIDLHLEQEIPTFVGKSRITLFGDIENLPNLINKDWGGLRQTGFPYTSAVVQVACLATATPTGTAGVANTAPTQACTQYRYSAYRAPSTGSVSTANSLYLIRIGARFSF